MGLEYINKEIVIIKIPAIPMDESIMLFKKLGVSIGNTK
jgi:hypothetical protein